MWWKSNQIAFEYYLQARTEKDVEVFDQVRQKMDRAQEKQKESYRSRIKKRTKRYNIQANYLVWKKDERKGYLGGSQQSSPVGAVGRSTTGSTDALHFSEAQ